MKKMLHCDSWRLYLQVLADVGKAETTVARLSRWEFSRIAEVVLECHKVPLPRSELVKVSRVRFVGVRAMLRRPSTRILRVGFGSSIFQTIYGLVVARFSFTSPLVSLSGRFCS